MRLSGRNHRNGQKPSEKFNLRHRRWTRCVATRSASVRRLSGNATFADDLAQQVFIQVWRTLGQLSGAERFPGGLKRNCDQYLAAAPAAGWSVGRQRMSHGEIAESTGLALGTVKSHIRRGTERLQVLLADYADSAGVSP